ncbi:hypothetical protein V6Z11_A12G093500 [Gossypium hirsutum]
MVVIEEFCGVEEGSEAMVMASTVDLTACDHFYVGACGLGSVFVSKST